MHITVLQTQLTISLFPDLYYYYDMKLFSFGYNEDFNLVLLFPIFIEP